MTKFAEEIRNKFEVVDKAGKVWGCLLWCSVEIWKISSLSLHEKRPKSATVGKRLNKSHTKILNLVEAAGE